MDLTGDSDGDETETDDDSASVDAQEEDDREGDEDEQDDDVESLGSSSSSESDVLVPLAPLHASSSFVAMALDAAERNRSRGRTSSSASAGGAAGAGASLSAQPERKSSSGDLISSLLLSKQTGAQQVRHQQQESILHDELAPFLPVPAHDFSSVLSDYKVVRKLGQGTYGQVHEVQYRGQSFALKVQQSDREPGVGLPHIGSALIEADTLSRLSHPNLIRCHHVFWDVPRRPSYRVPPPPPPPTEETKAIGAAAARELPADKIALAFVLDMAETNLESELKKVDSDAAVLHLFRDVLCGLNFMHAHQLIHGDIKPANILLMKPSAAAAADAKASPWSAARWVLADFGLVQHALATQAPNTNIQTAYYRAPETILLGNISTAVDVWSVGVMLLEMVRPGGNPFSFYDGDEVLTAQIRAFGYPSEEWRARNNQELVIPLRFAALSDHTPATVSERLLPAHVTLRHFEHSPRLRRQVIAFLDRMLQMDPRKRATTQQLLQDPIFDSLVTSASGGATEVKSAFGEGAASGMDTFREMDRGTARSGGCGWSSGHAKESRPVQGPVFLLDRTTFDQLVDFLRNRQDQLLALGSNSVILAIDLLERYVQACLTTDRQPPLAVSDYDPLAKACGFLAYVLNEPYEPRSLVEGGTFGLNVDALTWWLVEITRRLRFVLYADNAATVCKMQGDRLLVTLAVGRSDRPQQRAPSHRLSQLGSLSRSAARLGPADQLYQALSKRQFATVCRFA